MAMPETIVDAEFFTRVRFISLLARRLHETGATAPRLERAIVQVSQRLGLACDSLSTPTSILLSFREIGDPPDYPARHTQVLRMDPGDIDLGRMARVDAIAEQVANGEIDINEGRRLLVDLPPRNGLKWDLLTLAAFATTAAVVVTMLRGGWVDVLAAAVLGTLVGVIALLAGRSRAVAPSLEVAAAFFATLLATLIGQFVVPLTVNAVVIASLIVLLPGLTLTTAAVELAQQHLVSGVARFAGALTTLLKLAFGSMAAAQLLIAFGGVTTAGPQPVPAWTAWVGVPFAGLAFAVLFRAAPRDTPLVIAAAAISYAVSASVGGLFGAEIAAFTGALVITVLSNVYGIWRNRPGALLRVPGIILLVPGSVGYRSVFFVFERDVYLGIDTAISMLVLLASLAAGLLFGNMLVRPRRSL
jgi:uncharacterized membrane protein YjjP (DUF1212 family)